MISIHMPAQVYTYIYTRELESSISFAVNIFQKIYNKKPALKKHKRILGFFVCGSHVATQK